MPDRYDSSPSSPDPSLLIIRKRVGQVRHVEATKKFGFIEAEDYRDDVFFHLSQWESSGPRDTGPRPGQVVEFEIDEVHRRETGKLRAKVVRATKRPLGERMSGRTDPHLMVKHHPKARQSKPKWRKKPGDSES